MRSDTVSWERTRRRDLRRRKRQAFGIVLATSVAVGLLLGAGQAWLRLERVTVRSSDVALAEEVSELIRVPEGANLLTTDLMQFVEQAQQCPRVGEVDVDRKLPDRLELTLHPRKPIMGLHHGGEYLLVDAEGVCLAWAKDPGQGVLRIDTLPDDAELGDASDVGGQFSGKWFRHSRALSLSREDAADLGPWVLDGAVAPELSVISASGARGVVGTQGDIARRAKLFAELLRDLEKRGERVRKMELRTEDPVWWSLDKVADGAAGRRT